MTKSARFQNTMILNSQAQMPAPEVPADREAMDQLFACTIVELRQLARSIMQDETAGALLQPTALVHEAYLRLFDLEKITVEGRAHFLNLAAKVMRRVLVDEARQRNTQKRGGGWRAVTLSGVADQGVADPLDLLALDRALTRLAGTDPRAAEVVELRVFAGLTMEEVAGQMGFTRRTIQKDWRFATMWLRRDMEAG